MQGMLTSQQKAKDGPVSVAITSGLWEPGTPHAFQKVIRRAGHIPSTEEDTADNKSVEPRTKQAVQVFRDAATR